MTDYPTQWRIIPVPRPLAAMVILGQCAVINQTANFRGRGWFLICQTREKLQSNIDVGHVGQITEAGAGLIGAVNVIDCCRPDELDIEYASGPWCMSIGNRRVFRDLIAIPPKPKTWDLPPEYVDVVDAAIDSSMDVREARLAYERHVADTTTEGKFCPECGGVDAHQFNCSVLKRIKNGPPRPRK